MIEVEDMIAAHTVVDRLLHHTCVVVPVDTEIVIGRDTVLLLMIAMNIAGADRGTGDGDHSMVRKAARSCLKAHRQT